MGKRKKEMANALKEARKTTYKASLRNIPSSPRKMRYVADLIRGMEVNKAFAVLRFNAKAASKDLEKLLRTTIDVWEQKNGKAEDVELYITKVFVDEGVTLKRMRPAPQGRGFRIRKRSNHVTMFVDAKPTIE